MAAGTEAGVRLNLGCGNDIRPGYVNHDIIRHRPEVDVVHDLRELPWPWPDAIAAEIRLIDVIEHLGNAVQIIDECWRIARSDCLLVVQVPHYRHENSWLDPTHVRPFHEDSFDYFDPTTHWGRHYGFYTARKWRLDHKEITEGGNVLVHMRSLRGVDVAAFQAANRTAEEERMRAQTRDSMALLEAVVPRGSTFILVDDNKWAGSPVLPERVQLPFLERAGEFWGKPEDDIEAIYHMERLRKHGAQYLVFVKPAIWWLDYYSAFRDYLRRCFGCLLDTPDMKVFDLRD